MLEEKALDVQCAPVRSPTEELKTLLASSSARHSHLCPRQVLGVRMGLAGGAILGLKVPRGDKRLLIILETDGCFADGIEVATGSRVGRRTLRIQDFGKVAATFVDTETGEAVRLAPRLDIRQVAWDYAPGESRHYFAQLEAYQVMPVEKLFTPLAVQLNTPIDRIISRAGIRADCDICGEEIINEREVLRDGLILCRACAGEAYYSIRSERGL